MTPTLLVITRVYLGDKPPMVVSARSSEAVLAHVRAVHEHHGLPR